MATVADLAARVRGVVEGDGSHEIHGVAALRDALPGDLSFLANPKYAPQLADCKATAVLVAKDCEVSHTAALIRVDDPNKAFAQIAPLFMPEPIVRRPGVHPTAVVGEGVELGEGVHVGPYAVLCDGCRIGTRTVIEAHVVVGDYAVIGEECHLYPMSSLRERVRLGNRVAIHNGTVIGSDGYGYSITTGADGRPVVEKIPQLGIVEIGDDVEIGANVTIDRARFGATKIGRGTKIDNLVQIAHNVQIGETSGIVAQVGISGSTHIGSGVMIWGQCGLAGHLDVGDGAQILAKAGVTKSVPAGAVVIGSPAVGRKEALKQFMLPRTVEHLKHKIEELEREIAELKAKN